MQVLKPKDTNTSSQPDRLAIGGQGGFQVDDNSYTIEKEHSLFVLPNSRINLPNAELPETVQQAIAGVLVSVTAPLQTWNNWGFLHPKLAITQLLIALVTPSLIWFTSNSWNKRKRLWGVNLGTQLLVSRRPMKELVTKYQQSWVEVCVITQPCLFSGIKLAIYSG